jgi:hypothetical protein
MAIQVNGCTVIDDDRNIVNAGDIRVGLVTITGSTGNIQTSGTITGAGFSVFSPSFSISPGIGSTNVNPVTTTSIILSFPTSVARGTGTIRISTGSTNGSLVRSYDAATAPEITVFDNTWAVSVGSTGPFLNPVVPFNSTVFLTIPSTAISGFAGLNTTGGTSYSFTTQAGAVGDPFEGGFLICKSGGVNWVVAPSNSQVSRTWYARLDSNTRAQQVSGCTGWFVPLCGQLQNPGYTCRTFWDSFDSAAYWSSTEVSASNAWFVTFNNGNGCWITNDGTAKTRTYCVRSFRCVTY